MMMYILRSVCFNNKNDNDDDGDDDDECEIGSKMSQVAKCAQKVHFHNYCLSAYCTFYFIITKLLYTKI